MNISVRNVKVDAHNSQETLCFSAQITIDDKLAFYAENNGTGGTNTYYLNTDEDQSAQFLEDAEEFAKNLTGENFEALDLLIGSLVSAYTTANEKIDTTIFMIEDSQVYTVDFGKNLTLLDIVGFVKDNPNAKVLNMLNFSDAVREIALADLKNQDFSQV
jgi:muramoyltetrapeptide carboxypeptidase LdcA involved in peptidoglycan recycling